MSILTENLEVSFEGLVQDLAQRGKSRYLEQFRESPLMQQLVENISQETQELYDEILKVLKGRTIGTGEEGYAEGVQLDKIGYLVGQDRVVANSKLIDYYSPDKIEEFVIDKAKVWTKNGRLFEAAFLSDKAYRILILSKIYKNHCKGASLPQVRLAGINIYGHLLTLVKMGLQHYLLGFLSTGSEPGESSIDSDSLEAIYFLRVAWNNTNVDDFYALPIPSTVFLDTNYIFIFPKDSETDLPNAFIPDIDPAGKTDYSLVAIKINIGGIYE